MGGGLLRKLTNGFWKVARGQHKHVLFVLEFVELG